MTISNLDGVTADARKRLEAAEAALQRPWDEVVAAPTRYWPKPAPVPEPEK